MKKTKLKPGDGKQKNKMDKLSLSEGASESERCNFTLGSKTTKKLYSHLTIKEWWRFNPPTMIILLLMMIMMTTTSTLIGRNSHTHAYIDILNAGSVFVTLDFFSQFHP